MYTAASYRRRRLDQPYNQRRPKTMTLTTPGLNVTLQTINVVLSTQKLTTTIDVDLETIAINVQIGGFYVPPTPVSVPSPLALKLIMLSQTVMPTPTIVNGRPT